MPTTFHDRWSDRSKRAPSCSHARTIALMLSPEPAPTIELDPSASAEHRTARTVPLFAPGGVTAPASPLTGRIRRAPRASYVMVLRCPYAVASVEVRS